MNTSILQIIADVFNAPVFTQVTEYCPFFYYTIASGAAEAADRQHQPLSRLGESTAKAPSSDAYSIHNEALFSSIEALAH